MADKEAEEAHEEHQEAKKADAEAEARFLQSGKMQNEFEKSLPCWMGV